MLEAKLANGTIFKKIVEALKELVNEANFDCNASGMSCQAMDTTHVALATMMLKSDGFDNYRCDRNIPLGINLVSLTKILKSAGTSDSITFKAEDAGDTLSLVFEANDQSDRICEYGLKLMSLDTEHVGIPDQAYDALLGMSSLEFSKIIRDLSALSESVSIYINEDSVKFNATGDIGSGSIALKPTESVDREETSVNISCSTAVSTVLSLKFLNVIAKAAPLANRVILGISEGIPVSIEYKIGDLGCLRYYLAPKVGEDEEN